MHSLIYALESQFSNLQNNKQTKGLSSGLETTFYFKAGSCYSLHTVNGILKYCNVSPLPAHIPFPLRMTHDKGDRKLGLSQQQDPPTHPCTYIQYLLLFPAVTVSKYSMHQSPRTANILSFSTLWLLMLTKDPLWLL